MKRSNFLWMAFAAITMASCQKELTKRDVLPVINGDRTAENALGEAPVQKLSLSGSPSNCGAWILSPHESTDPASFDFVMNVARKLKVSTLRDIAPVPGTKKVKTLGSEFNVILNFSSKKSKPMSFRTDVNTYKKDLRNTLAALNEKPMIAVIENEESNTQYYSGSAAEYIKQLRAAISVMHSEGIPVANGGITSTGLKYLVYEDYINRGMTAEATDYQQRMRLAVKNKDTKERAEFVRFLLTKYAAMDLDYVNFHWRSQTANDAKGLDETLDYLQRTTGKKIITNEIGQYDSNPETLNKTVEVCRNRNVAFVIWYSGEENGRSYPLQYENEALTKTGVEYQSFTGL